MKLISFIGTSKYDKIDYVWEDKSFKTQFACSAIAEFFKPDEIIILGTAEALEKNFNCLEKEIGTKISNREIPLGENETEFWTIFDLFTTVFQDTDESYLVDITNGPRSHSVLAILGVAFLKASHKEMVRNLFYGAYLDKQGEKSSILIDLNPMLILLDWAIAADQFIRHGSSLDIAELLNAQGEQVKQEARSKQEPERQWGFKRGSFYTETARYLGKLSDAFYLVRPNEIPQLASRVKTKMGKASHEFTTSYSAKPFNILMKQISASIEPFVHSDNQEGTKYLILELEMINWYHKHKLWPQAVTLVREWLVDWVMVSQMTGGPNELVDRNNRENYNQQLNKYCYGHENENILEDDTCSADHLSLISDSFFDCNGIRHNEFKDIWKKTGEIRNDINHAGHNKNPDNAENIVRKINEIIERVNKFPIPQAKRKE